MEEENRERRFEEKSLEDVLDCDVYTYNLLHNSDDEDSQEENNENSKFIIRCLNCGFVYNNDDKPKNYKGNQINITDYLLTSGDDKFRCPNCGQISYYEFITEEEYKKVMEKKKKREEEKARRQKRQEDIKLERFIKQNMAQFNDDLKRITEELEDLLFSNEISEKRFNHIFRFTTYNLYKKYERLFAIKGAKDKLSLDDFNEVTQEMSDSIIKEYKEENKVNERLDDVQEDINQDDIYLDIMRKDIEDREILPEDASDAQAQEYKLYYKQKDYEKRVYKLEREREYEIEKQRRQQRELDFKNKKIREEYVRSITKSGN